MIQVLVILLLILDLFLVGCRNSRVCRRAFEFMDSKISKIRVFLFIVLLLEQQGVIAIEFNLPRDAAGTFHYEIWHSNYLFFLIKGERYLLSMECELRQSTSPKAPLLFLPRVC